MAVTTTRHPLRLLPLLLGMISCEHTQPFQIIPPPPIVGPLDPATVPVRLTYNTGNDAYPAWTPDGQHLIYQAQRASRPDLDRCLFELPAEGGTAEPVLCDDSRGSEDSTNVFGPAALSSVGRLIYYRSAEVAGFGDAQTVGMYLAPSVPVTVEDSALALPVVAPGTGRADKLIGIRWLGDSGFLALGVRSTLYTPYPCIACKTDTLETGVQVFWVDMRVQPPVLTAIPGTARASSYAFVAPDTLYFTLNGDARILRTRVGSGPVDSVYALPPRVTEVPPGVLDTMPNIVRGVQVHGNIAYAVGEGWVTYFPDSGKGEAQWDRGGVLHRIVLSAGADTIVTDNPPVNTECWIRNLALSPDGHRLAAEGRLALVTPIFAGETLVAIDTTITLTSNLYQYVFP